jgi:hypothetical protein
MTFKSILLSRGLLVFIASLAFIVTSCGESQNQDQQQSEILHQEAILTELVFDDPGQLNITTASKVITLAQGMGVDAAGVFLEKLKIILKKSLVS